MRPRVLEHFSPDSCVTTTRITLDVLDYFGVAAKPLPVSVIVLNDEAYDILRRGGTRDDVAREVWKWNATQPGGPWTIGLGFDVEDAAAGHVAVALPRLNQVADFSIDQVSRRHKNLVVEPVVFDVDGDVLSPEWEGAGVTFDAVPPPVHLLYRPAAPRYRGSPNWRRTGSAPDSREVFRRLTADIIRAVREEVEV